MDKPRRYFAIKFKRQARWPLGFSSINRYRRGGRWAVGASIALITWYIPAFTISTSCEPDTLAPSSARRLFGRTKYCELALGPVGLSRELWSSRPSFGLSTPLLLLPLECATARINRPWVSPWLSYRSHNPARLRPLGRQALEPSQSLCFRSLYNTAKSWRGMPTGSPV